MIKTRNDINLASEPIGIFDSGIGGLTVVKEISRMMPYENIIYFGDTARVPYGNKSPETVTKYSMEITEFLISKGVKIIVIACNTASSFSLEVLQEKLNVPVLGVIEPGAVSACLKTKSGNIGVIGTTGTVNSRAYPEAIRKLNSSIKVYQQACPLFVQLAEEGWTNNQVARLTAIKYLTPLKKKNIDTLILGCTHYPLLKNVISSAIGNNVKLIDSGKETGRMVKKTLEEKKIMNKTKIRGKITLYVSDLPLKFHELSIKFMKKKIEKVHLVRTDEYINL